MFVTHSMTLTDEYLKADTIATALFDGLNQKIINSGAEMAFHDAPLVVDMLASSLLLEKISCEVMYGYRGSVEHWWIAVDGLDIDPLGKFIQPSQLLQTVEIDAREKLKALFDAVGAPMGLGNPTLNGPLLKATVNALH